MSDAVPAEYTWRLDRLRGWMARERCDLAILDSGEMLAWISGYSVSETMYRAVFVPREGAPWLVLRALDEAPCRAASWIADVVGYSDSADPVAVMAAELRRRGYGAARIGADFNSISWNPVRAQGFAQALPQMRLIDLRGASEALRWVKSAFEIEQIACAAGIADTAMTEIARHAALGITPRQAAALAAGAFLRLGADTGETGPILRSEGDHEFLHGFMRDDPLQSGDVLHVELIPTVARYGARLMRPVVIGTPSDRQRQVAAKLIRLQNAQIAAMRPGALASDVDRILRQGVLDAGLRAEYDNVTAYMLGLYIRTPRSSDFSRVFLPDQHWALDENMVFHVYASAAGIGFSETVVVTPQGGKRLTTAPRRLLIVGE